MKEFIFGFLLSIILIAVVFFAYQSGKQSQTKQTSTSPQVSITPSPSTQLVGNDRDEHGCIPSAGYTWCEPKRKCLRSWEETCREDDDQELMKQALFKKNSWQDDSGITVKVSTNDGQYASGTATAQDGGGYFFAAKVSGTWEIVADGNGVIMCSSLVKYPDFPKSLIPECYDQSTNKSIKR